MNDMKFAGAQIYFGAEAIKNIYNQTLTASALDIVCLSENYAKVIGSFFDKEFAPLLFNSKITTREILTDNPENRADSRKKDGEKNRVKFLKMISPSESDYMLYGDTAVLISYNPDSPFAVVVTDKDIVANLRNQFEQLWRSLL